MVGGSSAAAFVEGGAGGAASAPPRATSTTSGYAALHGASLAPFSAPVPAMDAPPVVGPTDPVFDHLFCPACGQNAHSCRPRPSLITTGAFACSFCHQDFVAKARPTPPLTADKPHTPVTPATVHPPSTPIGSKDLVYGLMGMTCPQCKRRGDKCRVFESRISGALMCEECMCELVLIESPPPSSTAPPNRSATVTQSTAAPAPSSTRPAAISAGSAPTPLQCPRCRKTGPALRVYLSVASGTKWCNDCLVDLVPLGTVEGTPVPTSASASGTSPRPAPLEEKRAAPPGTVDVMDMECPKCLRPASVARTQFDTLTRAPYCGYCTVSLVPKADACVSTLDRARSGSAGRGRPASAVHTPMLPAAAAIRGMSPRRSDAAGYGAYGSTLPGDYSRTLVPVSTLYGASPVRTDPYGLSSTTAAGMAGGSGSPRSMFLTGPTPAYAPPLYTGRSLEPSGALCRFCGRRVENLTSHEGVCVKNPRKNKA